MLAAVALLLAAQMQALAQRPPPGYICDKGRCVEDARGLPFAQCQAVCEPSSQKYTCEGGRCVNSTTGISLADCTQFCVAPAPPPPAGPKTIVDIAVATPDLSTLVAALKAGDLVKTLSGKGPFTVFAPTNEAFAALPAGALAYLLKPENKAQLDAVLTYHVVSGKIRGQDLLDGEKITTVEGQKLSVRLLGKEIFINSAKVTIGDVNASNGIVHIIDGVLIPPPPPAPPGPGPPPGGKNTVVDLAVATPDLSTLVATLKAGDLVTTLQGLGPFTVFAPTNEAFDRLPFGALAYLLKPENKAQLDAVLTYHVVAGPRVFASDLRNGQKIKTVEGRELVVRIEPAQPGSKLPGPKIFINNARVTTPPNGVIANNGINASNGVVHILDTVLNPDPPAPPGTLALVPLANCTAYHKLKDTCFQGPSKLRVEGAERAKADACLPGTYALRPGNCSTYGFRTFVGNDDIFKDVLVYQKPK